MCLFSRFVDDDEKAAIAARIVTFLPNDVAAASLLGGNPLPPIPSLPPLAKPSFPEISRGKKLADFVDRESLVFFIRAVENWLINNSISAENEKAFWTYKWTYRPTDRPSYKRGRI